MRKEIKLDERVVTDGVSKQGFTFYHRTGGRDVVGCVKTIKNILKVGFKPGHGDMYGVGMYGTTDRKSSFNSGNISSYGLGLIKYLVPVKGILIFDYNISALLFGTGLGKSGQPAYSLEDQLVRYGIFQAGKVPEIFQVLSWDLEKSFGAGNRTISADRAYQIFVQGIMKGGNIPNLAKGLSKIDNDMVDAYIHAAYTAARYKNFDRFKGVNGIVFSGNHDGNVIVMYKFYQVKPLMWGVSDPGDAGNPSAWAVPMQPCNATATAADLASMLVDMAADEGAISRKGSVDTMYIEGMDLATMTNCVKALPTLAPWIKNNLNGFAGICCAIPKSQGNPSVIYRGQWLQGTYSGYFGGNERGDDTCLKAAEKLIGKPLPVESYDPTFIRGTFKGGYFSGVFQGGVFEEGQFEGVFNGGLWKWNPKAVWGKNAVYVSSPNHFIEYEGHVYDLDTDPVSWVKRKEAIRNTPGGAKNLVDPTKSLKENIENSLPYDADVNIQNSWGPTGSVTDKFQAVRKQYAWLWTKIRFAQPPVITINDQGCILTQGSLTFGRVSFDIYEKGAQINGGVIEGANLFKGEMRAGIYSQGHFQGSWYGGTWNEKTCKWYDGVATFTPGATIGTSKVIATTTIVMGNGRVFNIIPEAYLTWKTIPELIDAIQSGAYGQVVNAGKKSGKSGTAIAKAVVSKYHTNKLTHDELLATLADDDDSDDSDVFGQSAVLHKKKQDSVEDLRDALNEFFDSKSREHALKFAEQEYHYGSLSPEEQDKLFSEFKGTYEKATGVAFSRSAFDWRADNWTFFGDAPNDNNPSAPVGGVAVRKQLSNDMYKLVASFGPFRSVMKGFIELNQKHGNSAIWGIVTPEMKKMLVRGNKDYVGLPGPVVKAMEPAIKKFSNGEVKSVALNGEMKVDTPAGLMTKVFVCNKNYVRWLIDAVEDPSMQSKLPVPQVVVKPLLNLVRALL